MLRHQPRRDAGINIARRISDEKRRAQIQPERRRRRTQHPAIGLAPLVLAREDPAAALRVERAVIHRVDHGEHLAHPPMHALNILNPCRPARHRSLIRHHHEREPRRRQRLTCLEHTR